MYYKAVNTRLIDYQRVQHNKTMMYIMYYRAVNTRLIDHLRIKHYRPTIRIYYRAVNTTLYLLIIKEYSMTNQSYVHVRKYSLKLELK